MSYHVTKKEESTLYEAKNHYDVQTTRLHNGSDVDGNITLGLSHFLPGGGGTMGSSPAELLYFVLEGQITVTTGDGTVSVLNPGDSMHFAPNQEREFKNTSCRCAQMLVVSCPAKA